MNKTDPACETNPDEIRRPGITKLIERIAAKNPKWSMDRVRQHSKVLYTSRFIETEVDGESVPQPNPDYRGGATIKKPIKRRNDDPSRPMVRIPISAAEGIAKQYGYDQVVIYARRVGDDPDPHGEHMTTYGINKLHCEAAAMSGTALQKFMGWKV